MKKLDGKKQKNTPLLEVKDLKVEFRTGGRVVNAVNGVSLDVNHGETLAILGESGSGKSITFEAVLGILDSPPGHVTSGEVFFEGKDLFGLSSQERRAICGSQIGMIFQDPLSALNPAYTVGWQMAEMYTVHLGLSQKEARKRSMELLERVGIPDVENRIDNYPHQFSGGMRQRLVIAMALAVDPKLIIADEPTTALDVTVEAQILSLLKDLQKEAGVGLVIITHSMGVVAEIADRVCVMYAGRVVERASVTTLFKHPSHPYTVGLMNSLPGAVPSGQRLNPIIGQPPDLANIPMGCPFHSRCPKVQSICKQERPLLHEVRDGHSVACHIMNTKINNTEKPVVLGGVT